MAKNFRTRLLDALKEKKSLSTKEIYCLFNEMNTLTVSWHLNDELKRGNIERSSHGNYVLCSSEPVADERFSNIPRLGRLAYDKLKSLNYDFYLSGLDCMNGLAFKVDGSYPVIICTKRYLLKSAQLELMREFGLAIMEGEPDILDMGNLKSKIQFVVLSSENFSLQKQGFAVKEKAFVDLYYAVTRLEYPLPRKEFPHILIMIEPNPFRFRQSTKDRGLSNELNFLLSYDREFLKAFLDYI